MLLSQRNNAAELLLPAVIVAAVSAALVVNPFADNAAAELAKRACLSQILQGYSTDPQLAKESNRRMLKVWGRLVLPVYFVLYTLHMPVLKEVLVACNGC